jgi:hypothetical protein
MVSWIAQNISPANSELTAIPRRYAGRPAGSCALRAVIGYVLSIETTIFGDRNEAFWFDVFPGFRV